MNECLFLQNEVRSKFQLDGQFFNLEDFMVYLVLALNEYTNKKGVMQSGSLEEGMNVLNLNLLIKTFKKMDLVNNEVLRSC